MGNEIGNAIQQFSNGLPPEFQKAISAIMSGDIGQYIAQVSEQWKNTGASAQNNVSEGRLGTGGLTASYSSDLDKFAPQRQRETFNPGVPTQRAMTA